MSIADVPKNELEVQVTTGNEELGETQSHLPSKTEATAVSRRKPTFFRSTLFQILVVGTCAFCAPGIWNAMNGLGVGGSESPSFINTANAIAYACMTVTCFAGPWMTNVVGFRWTLALGSIGYPLYAAGLYVNNRYGTIWFVYFGAVMCGISAGFFWSVEGAIATGYPEHHKRGRYLATWFSLRNLGYLVGGAVSLGLNHDNSHKGQVGYQTYQAFIAIQCLGLLFGLLLSNPGKVQRDDGTSIAIQKGINWRTEAKQMWRLAWSKPILFLTPLFWYNGWAQAYPGTYLESYFNIRSRALASFMSAVVDTLATWLCGSLVDISWTASLQKRAIVTFILTVFVTSAAWIWAVIIQNEYRHTKPELDWANQRTFGRGFGVYMLEWVSAGMVENYIYWCISNLSDSPGNQIRYSSLLRGIETAGVSVSFGVQATSAPLIATASINLGFWFFALPFSYIATLKVVQKYNQRQDSNKVNENEVATTVELENS